MHSRCYKELERVNMREFESGATRDTVEGKFDFEGFLSPAVLNRYAEYMNKHRTQADGNVRDSDNWQKGIPLDVYMKSGFRHFFSWWANHRHVDDVVKEDIEESLCALLFNVMGYFHEHLKDKAGDYNAVEIDGPREFQPSDTVFIQVRHGNDKCDKYTRNVVNDNDGTGSYIRSVQSDDDFVMDHLILVGSIELYFYDDEVFPVGDN